MADIEWPWELPVFALNGSFGEQLGDNIVKFEPDVGPALRRQRSTIVDDQVSFSLVLRCHQVERLRKFYKTDCAGGALSFYHRAFNGGDKPYRELFQWDSPPQISHITGDAYGVALQFRRIN